MKFNFFKFLHSAHQKFTKENKMKPSNLLIYYGWLNAFNSAINQWNNEKVAQELAKYDVLVFGDGIQDPSHGDFTNTQIIVSRIKVLNATVLIFGYVDTTNTLVNFQSKTDQWNSLGVQGIFMDKAGYDFGINRTDFNTRVDYVHARSSSKLCFVNAWNEDHIHGTVNDSSYPNSTFNPTLKASKLTVSDWYLLESFSVNTQAYSGNNGYAPVTDWLARGIKASQKRTALKPASVGIINDDNNNGQNMFDFSLRSAMMFELEANGTSHSDYGASSASTKWWDRTGPKNVSGISGTISVTADVLNTNVYLRYVNSSKISIDHTTNAQMSSVEQW